MESLDIFIRQLVSKGSSASKNTVKNYISDIRHFITWYEKSMKSNFQASMVTADIISLYRKSMGSPVTNDNMDISSSLSVASMKRHISSLRRFFAVLREQGIIQYNPFDNLEVAVEDKPTGYWHLRSFSDFLIEKGASKITIRNYISDIQGFSKWYEQAILPGIESPLTSAGGFYMITQDVLNEYKSRLINVQNAAPRTINRKLSALRRYLAFAQEKGFISTSELFIDPVDIANRQEGEEAKFNLKQIKEEKPDLVKSYSSFPPFRLIQALIIFPYLAFEIKSANIIASIITGKPVEGLQKLPSNIRKELNNKNLLRSKISNISSLLNVSGVEKAFYEPQKVSLLGQPLHKKVIHHARFTRPSWYHKYHNFAFVHYVHFALLILFASGVGVALYNNLVGQNQRQASAASTSPPRVLSFQGRLTDNLDNPITTPQQLRFMIYNDSAATGSANLWEELRTVEPDQDGIFSVVLGSDINGNNAATCGAFPLGSPATSECLIPTTVFSDNSSTWLGVTVGATSELTPRQRIATVAYATNSEFLQGLPPITSLGASDPKVNTVLALDSSGNLTIGGDTNPAPIFQATDGQFTLSGDVLLLRTVTGTGSNVVITPDGLGKIDLTKSLINTSQNGNISPGGVEVNDKFAVLATESAVAAFIVNNNTTGGDIFTASSSGTPRFTIGNDGQITDSFYTTDGGIIYTTGGIFNQTTTGSGGQCLQSAGGGTPTWGTCGSGGNWTIANGTIYPINETLDLLVGGTSTSAAKFRVLNMLTGTPVASVSANSGDNATFISGDGNIGTTNRQTLSIGNSFGFNTTGNILFNSNGVGSVGFFTTTPRASFDVRGISGTATAASISATTSGPTLLLDNSGTGDFLAASKGGQIYFRMSAENGNYFGTDYDGTFTVGKAGNGKLTALVVDPVIVSNQKTSGTQSLTLHTAGSTNADFIFQNVVTELARLSQVGQFSLPITDTTGGIMIGGDTHIYRDGSIANQLNLATGDSFNIVDGSLLIGGVERIDEAGAGTFTDLTITGTCSGCGAAGEISPFQELSGAIVPLNSTLDFLIGGQSTDSAKFSVLNMANDTPTASISAGTSGALYLTADGQILATNNQDINIGNIDTGVVRFFGTQSSFDDEGNLNAESLTIFGNDDGIVFTGTGNHTITASGGVLQLNDTTLVGDMNANTAIITNIGNAGTDFDTGGGLTLAGDFTANRVVTLGDGGDDFSIDSNALDISTAGVISGATGLTSSGTITLSGFTGANDGGLIFANSSGVLSQTAAGAGSQCLLGGTTPSWGSCGTGTALSPFQELTGAIVPLNATLDTLLGGQSSASATLRVLGSENPLAGTEIAAIISSETSAAGLIVENSGVGNIFAASSSGTTRFSIDNSGNTNLFGQADLRFMDADSSNYVAFQAPTAVGSNVVWTLPDADSSGCFQSNGAGELTISTCGSGGESFWNVTDGVLHPGNTTLDLAIGGTSSTSAKFLFANVNSGDPTLQIFNSNSTQSLDLYHDGTDGNIISSTGTLNLGLGGGTLYLETDIVNDTANFDGAVKVADKFLVQNSEAAGTALAVFDNTGAGDILAASASGTSRFAITSAGGIRLGTSEGTGGQCLQSGGDGVAASWGPCASQTPWTSDIDADGFDLGDLSNLGFRETTGAPTGTDVGLFRDNSGDLNINALTGKTVNLQINGTDEYNFSATEIAMNGNNITGVGTAITAAAGLAISTTTTGVLSLDSGTTGDIDIGTGANAKTLDIGNTTGATAINLISGTGGINIGDGTPTKTIDIGGNNSSASDTIRIATSGTLADTISIGNANSSTTVAITGGNDWSIDASGNISGGGILQVGSATGTTYSRLGTGTSGHSLSGAEDLLVSGDFEVDGTAWFDGNIVIGGTCTGCGGGGAFDILSTGVTVQKNQTTDLLIGSSSTSSAKFSILNVAGSLSPIASISATTASGGDGNGIVLSAAGTIQSLRNNDLTIGGNTTGELILKAGNTNVFSTPLDNLLSGKNAGLSLTSGGLENVLLGNDAGQALTTGDDNTIIGYQAGYANTSSTNVFVGHSAGYNDSSGNNLYIGWGTGFGAVSNSSAANVVIGNSSLPGHTDAVSNVIVGESSALNLTSGDRNVLIGPNGGDGLTTGSDNVMLGYFTQVQSGSISNSVGIGSRTLITASNQLVVGDDASGYNISDSYWGEGVVSATPSDFTFNATGGSGTNIAGANLILAGGKGTGNAAGGNLIFSTSQAGSSGTTLQTLVERVRVSSFGNVGIGLVNAPTGKSTDPLAKLDVWSNLGTAPAASFSARTSGPVLVVNNESTTYGDLIVASMSGQTKFRLFKDQSGSHEVTLTLGENGLGKMNALDYDPPYTIDGLKYATYAPSTFLPTEEYTGKAVLSYDPAKGAYAYKLDFNNFDYQSDLWVFGRIIDPDVNGVKIFMTPNSSARTWYERDGEDRIITLFSDRPAEVSFRLTAYRVDYKNYSTLNPDGPRGLVVPPPPNPTGDGSEDNNFDADPYFDTLTINNENGEWVLKDSNGNNIKQIEAFSRAIIARINAGLVSAQEIVTGSINATTGFVGNLTGNTLSFVSGSFNNISSAVSSLGNATASTLAVTTSNVTIAGQSLASYIEGVVASYLAAQPISPIGNAENIAINVVSPLSDTSAPSIALDNSRVNIKNGDTTVSWFDRQGNASFSGTLTSNNIETVDATVSGSLAANTINSQTTNTQALTTNDATVSGTLRTANLIADNIEGLDDKIGTLAAVLNGTYSQPASGSGEYSSLFAGIVNATTINADFGIFEHGITSMGPITASHITAIDSLAVGSNLTISNNAINTLGAELAFQSLRQADITFQGGLIRMDTDGNMTIAGSLNLLGEIDAVYGIFSGSVTTPALATSLITPLAGDDLVLKLIDKQASEGSKLRVVNNQNKEVLAIDNKGNITSSGAATLSKLNFNLVGEAQASTLTEAIATGSAGFATLRAYQPEITVKNPNVTKDSLIYITPFGDTDNKVLYLLRQTPQTETAEGSFTVGASGTLPTENIQFNWLIVN